MDENTAASPSLADYYTMIKAEHEANNAWSAEQAQKAMDYQTQMSNTAHQREVADLKAAGLNPVLSAGGAGATTGSGIAAARDDTNVNALYGLAKMAIEAQIAQSNSIAYTASAVAGNTSSDHTAKGAKYLSSGGASSVEDVSDSSDVPSYQSMSKEQRKTFDGITTVIISSGLQSFGMDKTSANILARSLAPSVNQFSLSTADDVLGGWNAKTLSGKTVSTQASKVKNAITGTSVSSSLKKIKNNISRLRNRVANRY